MVIYGVKPKTGLYVVDMDTSRGYSYPKIMQSSESWKLHAGG